MDNIAKAEEYEKDSFNTIITPSSTEEELESKWDKYQGMHRKQQREADWKAQELFGKTNEELYNDYKSKFLKRDIPDDDIKTIDASSIKEEVETKFNYDWVKYPKQAAENARYWAANAIRSIVYPTSDESLLDKLYNDYKGMIRKNQRESDWKSLELFGMDNKTHYEYLKSKFLKKDIDDDDKIVKSDDSGELHVHESISSLLENAPDTTVVPDAILPYYNPDEIEYLAPQDNDWLQVIDKITHDGMGFPIDEWKKSYTDYCHGIKEKYDPKPWSRLVSKLSSHVEELREAGLDTKLYEDALLGLGWNPSIPYNESTIGIGALRYGVKYNTYEIIPIEEDTIIEERFSIKEKLEPVYIVLVQGHSAFSKAIMLTTKGPFSHAAIGTDSSLEGLYSFNVTYNGLSLESVKQYGEKTIIGVYTIFVKAADKLNIIKTLNKFADEKEKTHYGFLNIFTFLSNVPLQRQFHMICSQFVDNILKLSDIDITGKPSSLVSPNDFMYKAATNKKIYKVYEGECGKYNKSEVDRKLKRLHRKGVVEYIKEAKDLPVYFDDSGNLLIKNMRKLDVNEEFFKSHKLLILYAKNNNYEGIKYELSKLWFILHIIEKKMYSGAPLSDEDRKYYNDARARIRNDIDKYLDIVYKHEPDFNFNDYYEDSPFSDAAYKVRPSTIKFTIKSIKNILL